MLVVGLSVGGVKAAAAGQPATQSFVQGKAGNY